jgi:hypothetical protein
LSGGSSNDFIFKTISSIDFTVAGDFVPKVKIKTRFVKFRNRTCSLAPLSSGAGSGATILSKTAIFTATNKVSYE